VGDRSIIRQIFFVKVVLFQKRNDREELIELFRKNSSGERRLTMSVIVGRSKGRHCFRIDVGMGSRSQKLLDD